MESPSDLNALKLENELLNKEIAALKKTLQITDVLGKEEFNIPEQEKFSLALKTNPNAVTISRLKDGVILDINNRYTEMLGWKREEVIGKSSLEFNIIDDPSERDRIVALIRLTGSLLNHEINLKRRDGGYFPALLHVEMFQMDDEKIIVTTLQDVSQNKQTVRQLNEVENRYHKLFNTSLNGIAHCSIITDENENPVDFRILRVNDAYSKITGIPKDLVEGKTASEAFPDILTRKVDLIEVYGRVALDGGELQYESFNEKLNLWLNVYVYSPQIREFTAIFTDISERKRLEKLQTHDKELFEGIFNHIPVMITIYDPELRSFKFNNELKSTLGYTDEDGNDEYFMEKVYPDPEYRQKVADYMKSLETGWKEWKTTAKDGSPVDCIWANIPLSSGMNVGIGVDIRDRKKAEQALRESEERFSIMFNSMPINVSLTEIETGKIIDVNEESLKFFGCTSKEELIGKTTLGIDTIDKEDRDIIISELKKNGIIRNAEMIFKNLKKEPRVVSLNLNRLLINGKPYLLSTSMDISERKQLEEKLRVQNIELQKAKEKAEENDNLKTIFLANMSHEIRTPMTGILGFTELLKNSDITEEQKLSYLEIIESSGNRMLRIINDLIDFSKIEAKQVEINHQITDISQILNELNFFFMPEASNKGITLKLVNALPEKYFLTHTDGLKLTQILSNLLNNALKFTSKGSIEFGCELENTFYRFFVKDTGKGINREKTEIIFERFRQADLDYSGKYDGVGLGLAISKAYVELLGGKIFVKSEPGTGSEFYFTLPVVAAETDKFHAVPTESETHYLENRKVLIAEDDESIYFLLKEILRRMRITTLHASDGNEAVNLTRTHSDLDLIIMDTRMPILSGLEATRIIRTFNSTIPIIALSAYSSDADKQKALTLGCNDYLTKPMTRNAVIDKLLLHIHPNRSK